MLVLNKNLPIRRLHTQGLGILKMAAAVQYLDAAFLGQLTDAAAELLQNGLFPLAHLLQINLRRSKGDAAMDGRPGLFNHFGRMQQRLGRDAAPIQADAAKAFFLFDQDDLFALVRRVEGRGVTAWSGADDYDFSIDWFHCSFAMKSVSDFAWTVSLTSLLRRVPQGAHT